MTRKRYIWDDEVKDLVEITPGYEPSRKGKDAANHLGSLWGDRHYDGLRATDGADISTRKKHRDYMRKMGLTTADDYKSDWAKAQRRASTTCSTADLSAGRTLKELSRNYKTAGNP